MHFNVAFWTHALTDKQAVDSRLASIETQSLPRQVFLSLCVDSMWTLGWGSAKLSSPSWLKTSLIPDAAAQTRNYTGFREMSEWTLSVAMWGLCLSKSPSPCKEEVQAIVEVEVISFAERGTSRRLARRRYG